MPAFLSTVSKALGQKGRGRVSCAPSQVLRRSLGLAPLLTYLGYFCVATGLIERVKLGSASACGGTLAKAAAEGQQLESELREKCSKVSRKEACRLLASHSAALLRCCCLLTVMVCRGTRRRRRQRPRRPLVISPCRGGSRIISGPQQPRGDRTATRGCGRGQRNQGALLQLAAPPVPGIWSSRRHRHGARIPSVGEALQSTLADAHLGCDHIHRRPCMTRRLMRQHGGTLMAYMVMVPTLYRATTAPPHQPTSGGGVTAAAAAGFSRSPPALRRSCGSADTSAGGGLPRMNRVHGDHAHGGGGDGA
jgi:hypothetical protein